MPKSVAINFEKGFRNGLLTVIEKTDNLGEWSAHLCECDCGRKVIVKSSCLKRGRILSCGCLRTMINQAHCVSDEKDLTGKSFGKLFVLKRDFSKMGKEAVSWWIVQCECGKIKSVRRHNLMKKANNKSCGCARKKT